MADKSYKVFQLSHSATAKDLVPVVLEKNHQDPSTAAEWELFEVDDGGDRRIVKETEYPLAIKLGWGSGGTINFYLFRKKPREEAAAPSSPPTDAKPRLQFQHLIQPPADPPPPELLQKRDS